MRSTSAAESVSNAGAAAVSRWRDAGRRRTDGQRAGAITPQRQLAAARSSWSVTLAMALTTDDGLLAQVPNAPGDDGRGTANGRRSSTDRAAKLHDYESSCEFTQAC